MRRSKACWLAVLSLVGAAIIGGCATGRNQQTAAAKPATAAPTAVADSEPKSNVRLAAYEQASPSDRPSSAVPETIVPPVAQPVNGERPSQPLDLATALVLTQGQN